MKKAKNLFLKVSFIKIPFIIKLLVLGVIIFIISRFFIQLCFIAGDSMNPTYSDKDMVLIRKFNIENQIKHNDIIVIRHEAAKQTIVKRVIGVPGDTIQIIDGNVFVNQQPYDEVRNFTPIKDAGLASEPITLADSEYFVLGDNRNASIDSRFDSIGVIPASSIIGIVIFDF